MERETLKSRLGFILLSAGCAIGIGNVWKFPYMAGQRSEEHTSELQSLMRISYAVFCLKKKKNMNKTEEYQNHNKEKTDRLQ